MRIETPARIQRPLPLVPLVDVVFLLLMFFMLSSTFTKFGTLRLLGGAGAESSAAAGATSRPELPGVIITVSRGPKIKINGIEASLDTLITKLNEAHENGARSGALVLTPSAEVQDLVTVLEQARSAKLRSITVMR